MIITLQQGCLKYLIFSLWEVKANVLIGDTLNMEILHCINTYEEFVIICS